MDKLRHLFQEVKGKKIALIGDIFLDEYIRGKMVGLSSEGPIPMVMSEERIFIPNAAAHAALLLSGFGVHVHLYSIVGQDVNGNEVVRLLRNKDIGTKHILQKRGFTTNSQTRISIRGSKYPEQDILHIRTPLPQQFPASESKKLLTALDKSAKDYDAVVVLDKIGHLITKETLQEIQKIARKHELILIGDSEQQTEYFRDFTAITPNEFEAKEAIGESSLDAEEIGEALLRETNCRMVFMTRGADGISVFQKDKTSHLPTRVREVFDVTGAGETVLAAITIGLLAGWEPEETARLANLAAGIAVSKPGLAEVTIEEIIEFEQRQNAELTAEKLVTETQLKAILQRLRAEGKKIVWTNGCFDIMHVGHILYLEKARSLGDLLVVGLNSDRSVRMSKGPRRPIVSEDQRAKLLTAMSCVDYVIIFDDQTPLKLLNTFKPDIYAKGGDYTIDTINQDERRLVESYGGEIALLPGVEGASTTNLIDKILETYTKE